MSDNPGRVLEQVGRQRGRAQQLGCHQGRCSLKKSFLCLLPATKVVVDSTGISFIFTGNQDSSAPEGGSEISIEKLETQLNTLKTMFAEKQKLVSDLEAYGPEGLQKKGSIKIAKEISKSKDDNLV